MSTIPISAPPFTVEQARAYLARNEKLATKGPTDHAYSKVIASRYTITAALILKYLAYCVRKRPVKEGRQWITRSAEQISAQYPYLSTSAISDTLRRLCPDVLLRERRFNRTTGSLSTAYAFANPALMAEVGRDLIYFNPGVATRLGIHEAIVLHRLQFLMRKRGEREPGFRYLRVPVTETAEKLGPSTASVSRALDTLVARGELMRNPNPAGKYPEFCLGSGEPPAQVPPPVPAGQVTPDPV